MKKRKNGKKGFTLVELIIVVAVLAVIAAIAIPSVNGVIARANAARDESQAQAFTSAIRLFIANEETNGRSAATGTLAAAFTFAGITAEGNDLLCNQAGFNFVYVSASHSVIVDDNATVVALNTAQTID